MVIDVAHEDSVTRTGREIRPRRLSLYHRDVLESRAIAGFSNFCEARRLEVRAVHTAAPANVRRDANRKRSRPCADIRYNRSLVQVQNLNEARDVCRVVRSLSSKRGTVTVDGEGQSRNAAPVMLAMSHCGCDLARKMSRVQIVPA